MNQEPHLIQERDVPITLDSKWGEGSSVEIPSKESCITLMGPFINIGHKPTIADIILQAVKRLRSADWTVKVIPDDMQSTDNARENHTRTVLAPSTKRRKFDPEFSYLSMNLDYESMEVKDRAGIPAAYIDTLGDDEEEQWISVECISRQAAEFIEEQLRDDFLLVKVEHVEKSLSFARKDYQLTAMTDMGCEELETSFMLKQRDTNKVVAKAHCSYQDVGRGVPGPTLELIETAEEWQGQGLGISLFDAIEDFYREIFANILGTQNDVRLYVCNVKSQEAFEWFQERGFRDDDGIGETLSKSLNEEIAAEEAPYIIRRCMGRTPRGTQCKVTSEHTFPSAGSLCFGGFRFCANHQHQEFFFVQKRTLMLQNVIHQRGS